MRSDCSRCNTPQALPSARCRRRGARLVIASYIQASHAIVSTSAHQRVRTGRASAPPGTRSDATDPLVSIVSAPGKLTILASGPETSAAAARCSASLYWRSSWMSPARLRSLPGLPRKLYRRSQALRQQREERRFRTRLRPDQDAPELLLSPHWDDAVLDCFALLDSERELKVVNVFAGVPSPGKLTPWGAITGDPARNVNAYWELFLGAVEEMPPLESAEIVHLDEARRQAKLAAMRCYRTQYPSLNYGARVVLGDPAIHGFEVRWELRPRGPQPHCAAA